MLNPTTVGRVSTSVLGALKIVADDVDMAESGEGLNSETMRAKWVEMAALIDVLAKRVGDPADFGVDAEGSLAADDAASHPFEVSQAVRHLINASVDQLHGAKTLVHESGHAHLAVGSTLARAALENTATALWILGPDAREERLERVLRWHTRNYTDQRSTMGERAGDRTEENLALVRQVAESQGIDPDVVARGYKVTAPIKGAEAFTQIPVLFLWSIASAFAHGRPWAYRGFLQQEQVAASEDGGPVFILRPREELAIWLPLQGIHLLGELLRLRDRRAGRTPMPPMPDGAPDAG
jgi:hypothetical protein